MEAHGFQRRIVSPRVVVGPILNAASKEDPANLSQFGVTNLDICTHDEQTRRDISALPNFVHGSVLEMGDLFEAGQFDTVVLGEYLEHCVWEAAVVSLHECRKVLADDGILVLTFPLDDRPAEQQHAKHLLKVWVEGATGHDITVAHQTVWEQEMLKNLFEETGWIILQKTELNYGFVNNRKPNGWGMTLKKR